MTFDPRNDVPTLEILSPPVADYAYFQGCEAPFDPKATAYSPVNAWWLAEAASLAYGDVTFIKNRFERSDLLRRQSMQWEMITSGDDTAGFVMHNDDVAIAVFRGTRVLGLQDPLTLKASVTPVLRDVITDGRFPLTSFDPGCVHLGFAEAFQLLSPTLMPRLEQLNDGKRSIWFAGHSLGGALATVAAARFGLGRCNGLYTFGSPRVGDAEFCARSKVIVVSASCITTTSSHASRRRFATATSANSCTSRATVRSNLTPTSNRSPTFFSVNSIGRRSSRVPFGTCRTWSRCSRTVCRRAFSTFAFHARRSPITRRFTMRAF